MRLASIGLSQLLQQNWRKNRRTQEIFLEPESGQELVLAQQHHGSDSGECAIALSWSNPSHATKRYGFPAGLQITVLGITMTTLSVMSIVPVSPASLAAAPIINSANISASISPRDLSANFLLTPNNRLLDQKLLISQAKPTANPQKPVIKPKPQPTAKPTAPRVTRSNQLTPNKDKLNPSHRANGAVRARSLRQLSPDITLAQTNIPSNLPTNRASDTTWRVLGQPVLTFDLPQAGTIPSVLSPDTLAPEGSPQNPTTPSLPKTPVLTTLTPQQQRQQISERIFSLNQRLAEIVLTLNPEQPWRVDVQPVIIMVTPPEPPEITPPVPVSGTTAATNQPKPPTKPKPKPKPQPVVKSAIIRLEGMPLMEVSAEDVANQNSTSIMDLANAWASALQGLLDSLVNRQRLFAVAGLPETILFQNQSYGLNPQVALDRGLFRTNGERTQGFTIFWEVPPDNNAYKIPPGNYLFDSKNRRIFLLNRLMQFIPYNR